MQNINMFKKRGWHKNSDHTQCRLMNTVYVAAHASSDCPELLFMVS